MKLVVLEGADGAGTSTHADLLAAALRAVDLDAVAWHHKRPALGDPYLDALAYAQQRADLVASAPRAVIVADRWHWSSHTEGVARRLPALRHLSSAEADALPRPLALALLDAPDAELDARITACGETVTALDAARRVAYRRMATACDLHVVTSSPVAEVTRALLEMAVRSLRRSL